MQPLLTLYCFTFMVLIVAIFCFEDTRAVSPSVHVKWETSEAGVGVARKHFSFDLPYGPYNCKPGDKRQEKSNCLKKPQVLSVST